MYAGLLNPQRGDTIAPLSGGPSRSVGLMGPMQPMQQPMGGLLDFNALAQQLAGPRVEFQGGNPFGGSGVRSGIPGNSEPNFRERLTQQLIGNGPQGGFGFGMPASASFGGGPSWMGIRPMHLPSAYTRMA